MMGEEIVHILSCLIERRSRLLELLAGLVELVVKVRIAEVSHLVYLICMHTGEILRIDVLEAQYSVTYIEL